MPHKKLHSSYPHTLAASMPSERVLSAASPQPCLHRFPHLFLLITLFAAVLITSLTPAQALKSPRPIGPDGRIHVLMYAPDEVYKFVGHYGYQSSIIFAADEEILTISMGDSTPWMINPSGNRIFLKPIQQDASTNMTVLTNKRSYLFELHAEEAESISDPKLIFILRFVYPSGGGPLITSAVEDVPDPIEEGLEKFNFNYSIRGSYEVSPVAIFDDGLFTYFEFRDKNASIPAFYVVDQWGNEAILNYRARDDYIVVEQVASRFTLRAGGEVVCVYNESRPFPNQAPPGFMPDQMGQPRNQTPMPNRMPMQGGQGGYPR